MEFQALIQGLKVLREPCAVTISTDSQQVQRGITEWLDTWKAKEWRKSKSTKGSRAVLNRDLWTELNKELASPTIQSILIEGKRILSLMSFCHFVVAD
jgi:ribonuclease HI